MFQTHLNKRIRSTRRANAEASLSLAKRRTWYADDPNAGQSTGGQQAGSTNTGATTGGEQQAGAAGTGTSSAGTQNTENHVPQARFSEVVSERNKALDDLKKLQQQLEKQEKAKLEEQGNFKKLAEDAQTALSAASPVVEKYRALEAKAKERNEARIKALPEHARKLVPPTSDPLELQAWLDDAEPVFKLPNPADTDAGKQGDKKTGGDGFTGSKEHQQSVTQRFRLN